MRSVHATKAGKKGQALIELSLFGAFLVLVLATLLKYGLDYNFQQQAQQLAFRRALKLAADPDRGTGSYMVVSERHVPNPTDMFGVGSPTSVSASASVTRDPDLRATAIDLESLDGSVMDIQTRREPGSATWARRVYKTAGFRQEEIPDGSLAKYQLIYGSTRVNRISGNLYRIVDSCSGQVVDYESCFIQSRMLVDESFCVHRCQQRSGSDCYGTCAQLTNPPNQNNTGFNASRGGAWYAAGWSYEDVIAAVAGGLAIVRQYTFPRLNEIFAFAGGDSRKVMGLQPGGSRDSFRDQSIDRNETPDTIVTDQHSAWRDSYERGMVFRDALGSSGYETAPGITTTRLDVFPSVLSGESDETWVTDK